MKTVTLYTDGACSGEMFCPSRKAVVAARSMAERLQCCLRYGINSVSTIS